MASKKPAAAEAKKPAGIATQFMDVRQSSFEDKGRTRAFLAAPNGRSARLPSHLRASVRCPMRRVDACVEA